MCLYCQRVVEELGENSTDDGLMQRAAGLISGFEPLCVPVLVCLGLQGSCKFASHCSNDFVISRNMEANLLHEIHAFV